MKESQCPSCLRSCSSETLTVESENKRQMRQRRTMAEFRWILMVLFLILRIHVTAVAGRSYITVRDGDDAPLPCGNVINIQDKCARTDWTFNYWGHPTVELVRSGQIEETQTSKSHPDKISVTKNCSLVIKKVTDVDVGLYSCRQDPQQNQDFVVELYVVSITEHKDGNQVTLTCSVQKYETCRHTVKWLFNVQVVENDHNDLKTSQSDCSASVTFKTTHFIYSTKKYDLLKCDMTHHITKGVQQFTFRPQSSGEDTKTSTIEKTTTSATNTTREHMPQFQDWWKWLIIPIVGLVALLIITVLVKRCKRRKGNEAQMDEKIGLSLNPAQPQSGPEISQDMTDPEEGVSYASVNFTRKTVNTKVQVPSKDEGHDEGEAVTYSSVKASSSAGDSTDPSSLYAAIN